MRTILQKYWIFKNECVHVKCMYLHTHREREFGDYQSTLLFLGNTPFSLPLWNISLELLAGEQQQIPYGEDSSKCLKTGFSVGWLKGESRAGGARSRRSRPSHCFIFKGWYMFSIIQQTTYSLPKNVPCQVRAKTSPTPPILYRFTHLNKPTNSLVP